MSEAPDAPDTLLSRRITRRKFLKATGVGLAGAVAAPAILRADFFRRAPSTAFTRAVIGVGSRGSGYVLRNEAGGAPRTLAVCDVDRRRMQSAAAWAGSPCKGYTDFRDVLDRNDIEVVYIATPPHWHALISIQAAQAGKDIFCEKPMTRFIHEGRAVVEAVKRYGRVFQIGTRACYDARKLRKLVGSGLLGSPLLVRMDRSRYMWKVKEWSGRADLPASSPPPDVAWDLWLGPAPVKPFHRHRMHKSFRGYWDYDGGGFSDMGAHHFDAVQYIIGADSSGPVEVEAEAPWPAHPDAVGLWGRITYRFAGGTVVRCTSGEWGTYTEEKDAPFIEGPRGKVYSDRRVEPPEILERLDDYPDPPELVEFETALRTRQEPGGNAEASHRVATILHLGNLAVRLGRKLHWDPQAEAIVGDEEASRWVNPPPRAPWHL